MQTQGYTLDDLGMINIVLGKNGCGKSIMLRKLEGAPPQSTTIRYITPERGGYLECDPGVEDAINRQSDWMNEARRNNLSDNFRQQSIAQYKKLESLVLREMEQRRGEPGFMPYLEKLNQLLDGIEIRRGQQVMGLEIYNKKSGQPVNANSISSGESELISLGVELLVFSKELKTDSDNWLLIDEPDVHLHPDLQVRLINFLEDLVQENGFPVVIATHSTAILGAFKNYDGVRCALMVASQNNLSFKRVSESYRKLLPVFGAHPLTNIFNEAPVLIVEGESDIRVWQEAVRSSKGSISVYPCAAGSVSELQKFESDAGEIIKAVYDNAKGYSLRDGDGVVEQIEDNAPIVRMRLDCRTIENLLLSDEALEIAGLNWGRLQIRIENWLEQNADHCHYKLMQQFKNDGYDRKQADVKGIRNDITGIVGTNKPWEVIVGRAIAKLATTSGSPTYTRNTVADFLGKKVVDNLMHRSSTT